MTDEYRQKLADEYKFVESLPEVEDNNVPSGLRGSHMVGAA